MIEHSPFNEKEFTGAKSSENSIYHIKGNYELFDQDRALLPVNRIYSPSQEQSSGRVFNDQPFQRDRIIHEVAKEHLVQNELKNGEILVEIYGRELLFLENNNLELISPEESTHMSETARRLLYALQESVRKGGFNEHFSLGVFGSHQFGVNSEESDVDLLAWVEWRNRDAFLDAMRSSLMGLGYQHKSENELAHHRYAKRYAERSRLPIEAGQYLADKRNRWVSPEGVSTSIRCFNTDFNHSAFKGFIEGVNREWISQPVELSCRVVSTTDAYNCPALWQIDIEGQLFQVVSFYLAHQGMGDDKNPDQEYILKGSRVENEQGVFFYLADQGDYIIPKDLVR